MRFGAAPLCLIIGLVCLSVAQPFAVAQAAPAPLPPAAQEALSKGIMAAKVPDYPLAIRYFEAARKAAPEAPVVFLNLGIAESKIPGRELRAIAWFGAYLAAYPDAPNAAAVREQIAVLDVRNQSNVSRLIKTAQEAADLIREASSLPFLNLAEVQIKAGDKSGARRNLASAQAHEDPMQGDPRVRSGQFVWIATDQIKVGDDVGAWSTLMSARKAADRITEDPRYKADEQYDIASAQIRAGDIAGAQGTLAILQATTALIDPKDIGTYQFKNSQIQKWIDTARAKAESAKTGNSAPAASPDPEAAQPPNTVSDWLKLLDDGDASSACPLNTAIFLEFADHLKSLPPSDDPETAFDGLYPAAKTIVTAQNVIHQMLKQQPGK